jgi:hypothetical protein
MSTKFNNIVKTTVFPDVFPKNAQLKPGLTIDPSLHANVVSLSTGQISQTVSANTSGK